MTSLNNLHINAELERLIYALDPNWKIGKSVPTRRDHIYNRSLYYNRVFIAKFTDEDFHTYEHIYEFIKIQGYEHPKVIQERIRLKLEEPSIITDSKIRKELIKKNIITKEQAKKEYPLEYAEIYQDEQLLIANEQVPMAYAVDPYNPAAGYQTYYKLHEGWADKYGNFIDFRKPCKSTWEMRKMIAMKQANLEDAFCYTEGTCLEVIGDIAQHVLKQHIIPALYNLSEDTKVQAEQNATYTATVLTPEKTLTKYFKECKYILKDVFERVRLVKRDSILLLYFGSTVQELKKLTHQLINDESVQMTIATDECQKQFAKLFELDRDTSADVIRTTLNNYLDWCEAQYKIHTELLTACEESMKADLANAKSYIGLHNTVRKDASVLQSVLTSDDPVIVRALTLPYTTGELLAESVQPIVQTYKSFIIELQRRIYSIMSAVPKLVSFDFNKCSLRFDPVYSHIQRKDNQAVPYMNLVEQVMLFKQSGYEAHLRHINRCDEIINREHKRFQRNHTEPYIPFFADKRKVLNSDSYSFSDRVKYIINGVNDLREMGWRAIEKCVTAFNSEGIRYRVNCDTLEIIACGSSCYKSSNYLYNLGVEYYNGTKTLQDVKYRCNDPELVKMLTVPNYKDSVLFKVQRTYNGKVWRKREILKQKYPEQMTPEMWDDLDLELAEHRPRLWQAALDKHLGTDMFGGYKAVRSIQGFSKIEEFKKWLLSHAKFTEKIAQGRQLRYHMYKAMKECVTC